MSCIYIFLCIILAIIISIKLHVKWIIGRYNGKERMDGKTVVVTGANNGIGALSAKDFAKRGARVIMVCRDMKKAEKVKKEIMKETRNKNLKLKHVDFTSLSSVRKCAREILAEEPRIDVLLNNAGASEIGPYETEDGLDVLMQINYFAPFLFTNILLGKLKKSAPSRIVNVASILHRIGTLNFDMLKNPKHFFTIQTYGDSKVALVSFTNELSRRLKGTGVTANSVHPGTFPSGITRHTSPLFDYFWNHILSLFYRTTEDGIHTSIYCSVAAELEGCTGEYFEECKKSRCAKLARSERVAQKLWTFTEEAVKLRRDEKHY